MTSIRGATTAKANTSEAILEAVRKLLWEIIDANKLDVSQVIDITFSATRDLNAVYPAVAARAMGIVEAGLFCVQEMDVPGSLPMCIRILLHADVSGRQSDMKHIYLEDAVVLRPDLTKKKVKTKSLLTVAIDGPSGAGKSTVAREVAAITGSIYVDTGAMYRAVALHNIRNGVSPSNKAVIEASLPDISIDITYDSQNNQRLILGGEDVTEALRTQQVAEGSSIVASYQAVRLKLVELQQALAKKYSVVMDGRDIGTHVLPNAQVKIYLDASLEERARRRMLELQRKGAAAEYETVKKEVETRDHRDMNRAYAPLVRAENAVYINSDGINAEGISRMIIQETEKARECG